MQKQPLTFHVSRFTVSFSAPSACSAVKKWERHYDVEICDHRFQKSGRSLGCTHPLSGIGDLRTDRVLSDPKRLLTPTDTLK